MRRVKAYVIAAAVVWLASCGKGADKGSVSEGDLKSDNVLLQLRAIERAGSTRDEEAVPDLIGLLDSPYEDVRLNSVLALRDIGDKEAASAIVEMLDDESLEVRRAAVTALGQLKVPDTVPHLIRLLVDDDLELDVIWAMGNIGDTSAVPVLNRLQASDNPYVTYNASKALAKIK